jgi:PKD repeat protein
MRRLFLFCMFMLFLFTVAAASENVEQWGMFELSLNGPDGGNPFLDIEVGAEFTNGNKTVEVHGFYDGDGIYKIRFMPDIRGDWTYVTKSNADVLHKKKGSLTCIAPSPENHGPVQVRNTYYLAYEDGTSYFQIGTTSYAWAHQGDEMEEQTLETLKTAPFNKMRMCVFPKDYVYNRNEPKYYPFEGTPIEDWDYNRFNPEFFRHFEERVGDLQKLGIEADIILFHPYDRWGFAKMDDDTDDLYLKYVVARLSAYRNVWWSMANEFDFMRDKEMDDWDRFFKIVRDNDPYGHMRGIHNGSKWYDHTKSWVTHASIQHGSLLPGVEWRERYKKPSINDECRYEGNVSQGWGNITAQQLVNNFWLGTVSGVYVGHGETYQHPDDILWWSKGGVLHGESPERIAYLKSFMSEAPPFEELFPEKISPNVVVLKKPGKYYLVYFANAETAEINLPGNKPYKIDQIDTWGMTIKPLGTASPGKFDLSSSHSDYVVRLTPYLPGETLRPEVKVSANPLNGSAPLKVQFNTPSNMTLKWDFGDGASSVEKNPSHVYSEIGRFAPELTVIDSNGQSAVNSVIVNVLPAKQKDLYKHSVWPGSHERLHFLWENNTKLNRIVDENGKAVLSCVVEPGGAAVFGQNDEMALSGGKFLALDADGALLNACMKFNQLTVEAFITTESLDQGGPARIVTFSKDSVSRNFTLGQENNSLVMRLRTPSNGGNAMSPQINLCSLKAGEPVHVIVSYFPGNMYCYVNGKLAYNGGELRGDFSNWENCHLLFGDEWTGDRSWKGKIEGVALYSRFVHPDEAQRKYSLYMESKK